MKLLITGGAGFLGARLAREILKKGELNGLKVTELHIADLFPAPADLLADSRVKGHAGPMLEQGALFQSGFDGVFHLASAVSGECEQDFDLGMRSNLDSTRLLLEFGPDPSNPMPNIVADNTLPSPQTSYGTHKLMLEYLLADFTRKGYFSGIIREPLAGQESICPVDENVSHSVSSPNNTIKCLIAVFEASREAMQGRLALNLPGLNVTVKEMLQALEEVAGPAVRQHVKFVRNEQIAGIVANWAKGGSAQRAAALGLKPDASFKDIIQQYIDDCQLPYYPSHALDGLKK
ncbi:MAG: UDP-glucose 4-epimerase [Pseudomonadota bacterium]